MAETDANAQSHTISDKESKGHDSASDAEKAAPLEQPTKPPVPPDGGLKAWLCVLGSFCALFVSFGFLTACGIFQEYYEEVLLKDESTSSISWIITIALFVMYCIGPFIGRLADIINPRFITIPSSILIVFSICMLSLSTQYYQVVLTEGIAFGIGAGCLFLIPMLSVTKWFSSKRGLAIGISACGSSIGGVIFPIFIPKMIEQHGFPAAVRWTALLMGCLLIISVLTISSPFPPTKGNKNQAINVTSSLKECLSWSWVLFFIGCFFTMWGFFAPYDYLPLFAILRAHTGSSTSNYMVSVTSAGSTVGRVLPGYLSDKYGQFNVMMGVATLSGISCLVFWLPLEYHPKNASIFAFGAVYGFLSGGFVSLLTPCIVKLCRGKLADLGIKMGVFFIVIAVAALTGLPILGAIKDSAAPDDFVGLIVFGGVVMTVGGGFVCAANIAMKREDSRRSS